MDTTERFDTARLAALIARVTDLHDTGYRLVQIGCLEVGPPTSETKPGADAAGGNGSGDNAAEERWFELIYSFDKNYSMTHLRVRVPAGEHLPSVSPIYDMAFLYENEVHDLFGLPFDGISLDFHGTFYQKQVAQPFCSTNGKATAAN